MITFCLSLILVGQTSDTVDCNLTRSCVSKPKSRFIVTFMLMAAPLMLIMGSLLYFVHKRISLESKLVDYWWRIHLSDIQMVSTRRKNVKDGSLVMAGAESLVSSQLQSSTKLIKSKRTGAKLVREISCGSGSINDCGKTNVTKATNTTAMASSLDVCYGDISLGIYKLSKVALKPISKFHQSRKLMIELRNVST